MKPSLIPHGPKCAARSTPVYPEGTSASVEARLCSVHLCSQEPYWGAYREQHSQLLPYAAQLHRRKLVALAQDVLMCRRIQSWHPLRP